MEENDQEMREVTPIATSRLLALPRELRNFVYKELIYTIHEDVVSREKLPLSARPRLRHLTGLTGHPATSSPIYAILNTCRPLRAEFTEELYKYAHEDCTVTSTSLGLTRATHYGLTSTTFYNAFALAHGPMSQSPIWTINALPVPQSFSQHLRSFFFSFSEDELCPMRGIHCLNPDMELAVTNILSALPQLEYLQVALLLPPGPWSTGGPGPGLHSARITGFRVPRPGDKKSSKTPEPTRVGRRLKQFKKSIQVKFASLPNFPFTWECQEDCFKDGKRKDFTRTSRSIRFVGEWSLAPRESIKQLFSITNYIGGGCTDVKLPPDESLLTEAYSRWDRYGRLTMKCVEDMLMDVIEDSNERALQEDIEMMMEQ